MRTNGNVIVIIDHDKIAQLQVSSGTSSFTGNTLHSTAIPEEGKSMIVDYFEPWLVEFRCCVSLCDCQDDSVCKTLTKGASGNLNTGGVLCLRMTGGDTVNTLMGGAFSNMSRHI